MDRGLDAELLRLELLNAKSDFLRWQARRAAGTSSVQYYGRSTTVGLDLVLTPLRLTSLTPYSRTQE